VSELLFGTEIRCLCTGEISYLHRKYVIQGDLAPGEIGYLLHPKLHVILKFGFRSQFNLLLIQLREVNAFLYATDNTKPILLYVKYLHQLYIHSYMFCKSTGYKAPSIQRAPGGSFRSACTPNNHWCSAGDARFQSLTTKDGKAPFSHESWWS
jgi:hypothetical protein